MSPEAARAPTRLVFGACVAGALGLAGIVTIALANPAFALQGWLAAAFALSGVPLGALGLLLLHPLVGGPWFGPLHPVLRACAQTLPLFALAFVPVIGLPSLLYPWAGSGAGGDPTIAAKAAYLNPGFFALRTVAYFSIWIALTALIVAQAKDAKRVARRQLAAAAGVILYALTVSFAAVDWAMSVDPEFSSSAFGMLVGTSDLLAGLAFAIPFAVWLGASRTEAAGDRRLRDALAGLLATGVLLWAYLSFMQYLVVWSGDLPPEASWYLDRVAGGWSVVPWVLGLLLGAIPLVALALPAGRRSLRRIAVVAALISTLRLLEAAWLVLPSFPVESWLQPVAWAAAALAIGGTGLATVTWLWAGGPKRGSRPEGARYG